MTKARGPEAGLPAAGAGGWPPHSGVPEAGLLAAEAGGWPPRSRVPVFRAALSRPQDTVAAAAPGTQVCSWLPGPLLPGEISPKPRSFLPTPLPNSSSSSLSLPGLLVLQYAECISPTWGPWALYSPPPPPILPAPSYSPAARVPRGRLPRGRRRGLCRAPPPAGGWAWAAQGWAWRLHQGGRRELAQRELLMAVLGTCPRGLTPTLSLVQCPHGSCRSGLSSQLFGSET